MSKPIMVAKEMKMILEIKNVLNVYSNNLGLGMLVKKLKIKPMKFLRFLKY